MATPVHILPLIFDTVYTAPRRILISKVLNTAGDNVKKRELLEDVINYILLGHSGQHRKGDKFKNPNNGKENIKYFTHQYMVWVQGIVMGIPFHELVARLLHDTPEDALKFFHRKFKKTRKKVFQDIAVIGNHYQEGFGDLVVAHVKALTNKKGLKTIAEKEEWQLAHFKTLSVAEQNSKLADKLANMWDTLHNPPTSWSYEKKVADMEFAFQLLSYAKNPPSYISILLDILYLELEKQ